MKRNDNERMASPMTMTRNHNDKKWQWNTWHLQWQCNEITMKQNDNGNGNINDNGHDNETK